MDLYEELELQETQRALDSCASEEVSLREPKTPTQEQIDIVANKILMYMFIPHPWVIAERAIVEWEKIRNS